MTIDERLEALTMNLELMSRTQEAAFADIHAMQEAMQHNIDILFRSQVVMTESLGKMADSLGKVAGSLDTLAGRVTELAEAQRHTDQRMDALILTVDEIIRGRNGGPKV